MSKKLKYKIISCSSQQPQFPSSSLLFAGQNGGWQTRRFCTYPQEVTFQFYGTVKIQKIQIVSDNRKIPSQVDILFYMPFLANGRQAEQRFQKYGYLNFNRNQNSQYRQQKSIMVDIKCTYLRFLFHKPHVSKQNFFSQIGIQQISIYGNDSNSTLAPIQKLPRQIGQASDVYGYDTMSQDDPFVVQKLAFLNSQKERAVQQQNFQYANTCKILIDSVKIAGQELKKLNLQKKRAIQGQDYEKANNLKKSIQTHRKDIQQLIIIENYQNDNIIEDNQFNDVNQGNQQNPNDFQDNEFVDNQMNEMIKKSGTFSKNQGKNSRIIGGNSRVKINQSMLKRDNKVNQPVENYDDKVIPTLAGGGKLKTEQSQVLDKQQQKKDLPEPQQVDGKYAQFALSLQEHFQQQTVKCFFSQHWQLKVKALNQIASKIKSKPNADASFIKSLLIVVKFSISQSNFQVSQLSLQILNQLLKLNGKGNVIGRSNQTNNDLDLIIKQNIKKLTDNNNKIKQQAQKVFNQMINSSLYGPQNCVLSLSKTKQKVKLSSKQIISRLGQLQKIIEKHTAVPILTMASDFGIQNVKNPASEVRIQSLNLLLMCKTSDSSGTIQKKLKQKDNILELVELHQNKSQTKPTKNLSKPKKKK